MPLPLDRPYSQTDTVSNEQALMCTLFALHPTAKNVQVALGPLVAKIYNDFVSEFEDDRQRLGVLETFMAGIAQEFVTDRSRMANIESAAQSLAQTVTQGFTSDRSRLTNAESTIQTLAQDTASGKLRLTALESTSLTAQQVGCLTSLFEFQTNGMRSIVDGVYSSIALAQERASVVDTLVAMSSLKDVIDDTLVGIAAYYRCKQAKLITDINFSLLEPTTSGVFSVMMKINDVDVFATPVQFAVGAVTATYTIPNNTTYNANVVYLPADAKVSLHIVTAGVGAKAAVATLSMKNASTATALTKPTWTPSACSVPV